MVKLSLNIYHKKCAARELSWFVAGVLHNILVFNNMVYIEQTLFISELCS